MLFNERTALQGLVGLVEQREADFSHGHTSPDPRVARLGGRVWDDNDVPDNVCARASERAYSAV